MIRAVFAVGEIRSAKVKVGLSAAIDPCVLPSTAQAIPSTTMGSAVSTLAAIGMAVGYVQRCFCSL